MAANREQQLDTAREELRKAKENLQFGLIPFSDDEKTELSLNLVHLEKLRTEAKAAALKAEQAENEFKQRFIELANNHGVDASRSAMMPSRRATDVKLVNSPSTLEASLEEGRPCNSLHSCIVCDTVCCYAWECGQCEGCQVCTYMRNANDPNPIPHPTPHPTPPPASHPTPIPAQHPKPQPKRK